MTPEGQKPSENTLKKTLLIAGGLFLLAKIATGAFSPKTRKEIGTRDKWTCQDCGVQFRDGWMVHASHYNHDKSLPIYDAAENGRIQCVDCHQAYHEEHVGDEEAIGLSVQANLAAIDLLEHTNRGTQ
ncbi:MAG: hypothetical protein IFNCLDLE_02621 [Ignavibacteriaceae bacterium]|nr:hypothetical protein [Ignavibacteriaceae bacterium]